MGGVISVLGETEGMCEFGDELDNEQLKKLLELNFDGPLCAPLRVMPREIWLVDYWKDNAVRGKYFNMTRKQLKDPTKCHQRRIWVPVKI